MFVEEGDGIGGAVQSRNISRGRMRMISCDVGSASDTLIQILPIDGCGSIETTEISVRRPLCFQLCREQQEPPIHNSKASQE